MYIQDINYLYFENSRNSHMNVILGFRLDIKCYLDIYIYIHWLWEIYSNITVSGVFV